MSFKNYRRKAAFTLIELLIVMGLTGLILAGIGGFALYSTRSFYAFTNYAELNQKNQRALDRMTREIRQCQRVYQINSTNLTLIDANGGKLSYTYYDASHPLNPETLWVSHSAGGNGFALLESCRPIRGRPVFEGFRRTPVRTSATADYTFTPTTDTDEVKLVQINWSCSRDLLLGDKRTTESVQTAKVVIRYNEEHTYANTSYTSN